MNLKQIGEMKWNIILVRMTRGEKIRNIHSLNEILLENVRQF